MAWEEIEIPRVERLVKRIRNSADRLEKQMADARAAGFSMVGLQFKQAEKAVDAISSLVTLAEEYVPDQIESYELGVTPKWERALARSAGIKATRLANAELIEKKIAPKTKQPSRAKKATKKKGQ